MSPAEAMHFSIVSRNIDRDQKARLAFLATPRADDFQGARYGQTRCHPCAREVVVSRAILPRRKHSDYGSHRAYLDHRAEDAA